MSSGGGGSTSTTQSGPPAAFVQSYQDVVNQAKQVAGTQYQNYPGQIVAGLSPDQQNAITSVQNAQGVAQPYINSAAGYINDSTKPLWSSTQQFSPNAVQQYESPYTQDVVKATEGQFNNQNEQQRQGVVGNAISRGAFGGDREAVAEGILAGQQQTAEAPVIAGLENQGYSQALQEFNQQQGAQLGANQANAWLNSQAGFGMSNLGNQALSTSLTGANALLGIGGLEQGQAQSELNIPFEQFQAARAYPFQTTGWLANIAEGLGGASGGSSSTTSPGPSTGSQIAGAGLAGLGILGQTGAFGSGGGSNSGWLSSAFGGGGGGFVDSGNFDVTAAHGGEIPHRAGGGIVSTGVPDVSLSIVPGASGLGSTPSHMGGNLLNTSTGSTTTGSGPDNSGQQAMQAIGTAVAIAALLSRGGRVPSHEHGGIVVPFPKPHRAAGGIVAANDSGPYREPARAIGGGMPSSVTMAPGSFPGSHDVPHLNLAPLSGNISTGVHQGVQDYLSAVHAGAFFGTPTGFSATPPVITSDVPGTSGVGITNGGPMSFLGGSDSGGSQANADGKEGSKEGAENTGGGKDSSNSEAGGSKEGAENTGGGSGVGSDLGSSGNDNSSGSSDKGSAENSADGGASADSAGGASGDTGGDTGGDGFWRGGFLHRAPGGFVDDGTFDDGSAPDATAPPPSTGIAAVPAAPDTGSDASPWSALTYAGLGILGGSSPFPGVNIGRGALAGLGTYETQKNREALQQYRNKIADTTAAYRQGTLDTRERGQDLRHQDTQDKLQNAQTLAMIRLANRSGGAGAGHWSYAGTNEDGLPILLNGRTGETKIGQMPIGMKPGEQARADAADARSDQGWQRLRDQEDSAAKTQALRDRALQQTHDDRAKALISTASNAEIAAASRMVARPSDFAAALAAIRKGRGAAPADTGAAAPAPALADPLGIR